jgi:hypothetical protein
MKTTNIVAGIICLSHFFKWYVFDGVGAPLYSPYSLSYRYQPTFFLNALVYQNLLIL